MSGLPCPSPGDLPDPATEPTSLMSPALAGGFFTTSTTWEHYVSHSVVSNSLWPHGMQHARPPCPSPTPGAYSDSWPSSRWCHPTISSSIIPFSSRVQSFPASGSFLMSWLCIMWPEYWSFSFSISPSNEYSSLISFRIDWFGLLAVQEPYIHICLFVCLYIYMWVCVSLKMIPGIWETCSVSVY